MAIFDVFDLFRQTKGVTNVTHGVRTEDNGREKSELLLFKARPFQKIIKLTPTGWSYRFNFTHKNERADIGCQARQLHLHMTLRVCRYVTKAFYWTATCGKAQKKKNNKKKNNKKKCGPFDTPSKILGIPFLKGENYSVMVVWYYYYIIIRFFLKYFFLKIFINLIKYKFVY